MTYLSVLIPALDNRRAMLSKVFAAFQLEHPEAEILSVEGYTWGEGLNHLAKKATGHYLLTCCDDTVPFPGWFEPAKAMLDQGIAPQSRYFHPDGTPLHPDWDTYPHGTLVPWTRSFLLTRAMYDQVGRFIDATWYCDTNYSERLVEAGYEIQACHGFDFTHLESQRDWRTPEVDEHERREYELDLKRRTAA